MLEILPQPARSIVAVAGFAGLRKGEIRALRPEDYDGCTLKIERAAWRHHVAKPKGKRGAGLVPPIPTAGAVLDEHLAAAKVPKLHLRDARRRTRCSPALATAGIPWYGLHAFRRGLATNLHELGVTDIVIQAILRHSNVSVTRACYVLNDAVDPQSLAALEALESAVCNQNATGGDDAETRTDIKP